MWCLVPCLVRLQVAVILPFFHAQDQMMFEEAMVMTIDQVTSCPSHPYIADTGEGASMSQ